MKKIQLLVNQQFEENMKKLQDLNPEFSKSILIRFAVRAAAKQGLVIEFENPNIEHTTIGSSKEKQKKGIERGLV